MTANLVSVRRVDRVAIVLIDNPPVNAFSNVVRRELSGALSKIGADSAVDGVVIACAGRAFSAGADVTEFGTAKQTEPPLFAALCDEVEAMQKPVVAAIHGLTLGGGLELSLGCHYRVAHEDAKLGLPEVALGCIPGAGGTVRLPRLVGPLAALDIVVTGQPVSARDAFKIGLVDEVSTDVLDTSIRLLRNLAATGNGALRPVHDSDEKLEAVRRDPSLFEQRAAELLAKATGLRAPVACVAAVRNSFLFSFDEARAKERATFLELLNGEESKALRHAFFAEREARKVPSIGRGVRARQIAKVGVVGAGTMGGGIAMAFANAGLPVTIVDGTKEALELGLATIERNYAVSVSRKSLSEEARLERLARLTCSADYGALADCDLVVEAVFEDLAVKKDVFGHLARVVRPGSILATNTSYLDVDEIAASCSRPADVVGLHFFSPANVMKLVEIVRGRETSDDVIVSAVSLVQQLSKVPVVVGVCHGFVGNRMLSARAAESEWLLLQGATPEQIDLVFVQFGWPMGPFQMADLAGLDIGWRNRKALGRTALLADSLCEKGQFGQKTGAGWYLYEQGSRKPLRNPAIDEVIAATAVANDIKRRTVSDTEVLERTLFPMINEGARILAEGIAVRESDIDVVWINGYGFPKAKGGPMYWAKHQTEFDIVDRLDHWSKATGRQVFECAPSLSAILKRKDGASAKT